ncbi:MAG: DUF3179 domain-containing protein [Bacteroidota bacterium]
MRLQTFSGDLLIAAVLTVTCAATGCAQQSLNEWQRTDFTKSSVDLDEIMSGGPPKDGIPPIDKPLFVSFDEADSWLAAVEPVIGLDIDGEARAYPLQILTWHEIVNDIIGDTPVSVTFCPLCNAAIAFDRRVEHDGKTLVLDFGTTGKLRKSDLVMYDRQTESWWQQFTGEAIVGELTGTELTLLAAPLISYKQFKENYPGGKVLSRETGFQRSYGRNPYQGYDDISNNPFLFKDSVDPRLPAMERVINVSFDGQDTIYPLSVIQREGVIHDKVGNQDIVIFHLSGTASALDKASIADSRDVGSTTVFRPEVDGTRLTFKRVGSGFVDDQTGSRWNITGRAIAGPFKGKQLEPVIHGNHFAFAWLAFNPNSIIYRQSERTKR